MAFLLSGYVLDDRYPEVISTETLSYKPKKRHCFFNEIYVQVVKLICIFSNGLSDIDISKQHYPAIYIQIVMDLMNINKFSNDFSDLPNQRMTLLFLGYTFTVSIYRYDTVRITSNYSLYQSSVNSTFNQYISVCSSLCLLFC